MAGLNNLISDTQQTSTTMPAWYDQAQQSINTAGSAAATNAPTLGQTTAQGAVNTLQGPNNPFTQAQGTLQQISSGAANPWITDPTTGAVTPDTSTAMGGLFAAQQQQLNQLMPQYTAPVEGAGIASGNFGSLRGDTAVNKAMGDAQATLAAQQMQAALTNQQTGSTAAANLGNVGQQGINAGMNVGQAQMNAPFTNATNYANLIGSMQVPTTTTSQVQTSPLTQAATLANTLQGSGVAGGLGSLFFGSPASGTQGTSGYKPATSGLASSGGAGVALSGLGSWLQNQLSGNSPPSSVPSSATQNADGTWWSNGVTYDTNGQPINQGATDSGNPPPVIDPSLPTDPTGGGYVDPITGQSIG